jgi:hypothetical protein
MPPVSASCALIASLMQAIQDAVTCRQVDLAALRHSVETEAGGDVLLLSAVEALERGDVVAAKRAVRSALDGVLGWTEEPG